MNSTASGRGLFLGLVDTRPRPVIGVGYKLTGAKQWISNGGRQATGSSPIEVVIGAAKVTSPACLVIEGAGDGGVLRRPRRLEAGSAGAPPAW